MLFSQLLLVTYTSAVLCLPAEAVTVYHQPSPFPKRRMSGAMMPEDLKIVHQFSGWFGSYYNKALVQDLLLQIGGWGDAYFSAIRFDLAGLPKSVSKAYLCLWALPTGTQPSQVSMWPVTSDWTPSTIGWDRFPSTSSGLYWPVSTSVNSFRCYPITTWFNEWRSGARIDKGLLIAPYNSDGTQRFDRFVSSRSTDDGKRPLLWLEFSAQSGMPSFEMPVPGAPAPDGANWLLTNEIGGYECKGEAPWPDTAHQGDNYFSIDIAPTNVKAGGGAYVGDIPVLAAAGGYVVQVATDPNNPNGYFVVVNHGATSGTSGYTTRYLHLKDRPRRKNGSLLVAGARVEQGDQIGIMGTTGVLPDGTRTSTNVHLHFGVRYNNSGSSSVSQLTYATMDGLLLKSYQTECSVDSTGTPKSRIRYYHSSNTPTGR